MPVQFIARVRFRIRAARLAAIALTGLLPCAAADKALEAAFIVGNGGNSGSSPILPRFPRSGRRPSIRASRFEDARESYQAALRSNPQHARALWGLGRLAALQSRRPEAERYFARAYQADPFDPDIVLAFAEVMQKPEPRTTLLRNFLSLSAAGDRQRREHALYQLELQQRFGHQKLTRVAGPPQSYSIGLSDFFSGTTAPHGLLLRASINGSKPLRFVLDTGAEGIYLNHRAARKMNLELLGEARIAGLGASQRGSRPDHAGSNRRHRRLATGRLRNQDHRHELVAGGRRGDWHKRF